MTRAITRSLFGQLLLSQLVLFLLLSITLPVLVLITLHKTAAVYVTQSLRDDADIIVRQISLSGDVRQKDILAQLGPLYFNPRGSRAFRLLDESGQVIGQGGVSASLPHERPGQVMREQFAQDDRLDILRRPVNISGKHAILEVTEDRTQPEVIVDDVVSSFLRRILWIIPASLLASTSIGLIYLRGVTRQLERVSEEAELIHPDRLDTRLSTDGLSVEAYRLAAATNRALDRVEQGFRRQREFVSNVAHELRTPLALVAIRSDALPDTPARRDLSRAIDQATHVVDQLMRLAMLEGRSPEIGPLLVEPVVREAVEACALLVYRAGLTIEMVEPRDKLPPVAGNSSLLQIAVTNLIDNAVRHTPPGTHIIVKVTADAISIADNGPGIVAEESNGEKGKFRSLGQQRSDSAGLGLSIVDHIMAAMGGAMIVGSGRPGTEIVLRLKPI
jgi:signal transduction histidine kinase